MLKSLLILLPFCIAIFFLFTYRITDVPPGINGDEAAIGLNAVLISQTGQDSQNRLLPLFTNTKYSPDWKQPITVYSTALIFKIFGASYLNLRVTSVVFVILSALTIYLLIKEIIDTKIALAGTVLFLTAPIVTIQSHLAIENIAPVSFISLWLLMLVKYSKSKNNELLLLAGIFLGISVFSYLGMRMVAPVLAILTGGYIVYLNGAKINKSLLPAKWFLLGLMPFILFLVLSKFFYPGAILGQYRPYTIENYQTLLLPYLSAFDPSFLFIQGDATPYHSTGKQGMFLLASLPLFILGVINIIKKSKPLLVFILICFFMTPLFFGIGSTIHRASRLLALVPFYIIISSVGIYAITSIRLKKLNLWMLIIALLFISLNYIDFLNDYWYQYPQRVKAEFSKPIHEVYEKLAITAKNEGLNPYVDYYAFKPYPDAESFFRLIYFQQRLSEWSRGNKIPPKSIILTDLNTIPQKEKIEIVKMKELDYYLIINKSNNEI